jgi:RNA polymerase sigma-70 factor (ECF subfamily)
MSPATQRLDQPSEGQRELDQLVAEHESSLRRAFDQGRERFGPLPLDFQAFARGVVERLRDRIRALDAHGAVHGRLAEALERAAVADLFLAIACDQGIAGAWEVFSREFLPQLEALALRHGLSRARAREIAEDLLGKLATPSARPTTRTRFGTYQGRASLHSWLATLVLRRIADEFRKPLAPILESDLEGRESPGEGLAGLRASWPSSSRGQDDPSQLVINREVGLRLEESLREAWKDLTAKESQALLYKYRGGLSQREIARSLGLGESRVSRILQQGVEKIRRVIHRRFQAESPELWSDGESLWTSLRDAVAECLRIVSAEPRHQAQEGYPCDGVRRS